MDPLTLLLIAKSGLSLGDFFLKRREASKAKATTERQNAMGALVKGLAPQSGFQSQQAQMQQPGMAMAAQGVLDPMTEYLKRKQVPAAALAGKPVLDKGAMAAQNISRVLGAANA